MLKKTQTDEELEILIGKQRVDLLQKFEHNFNTQEQTLSLILKAKTHADFNKMGSNKVFWNAAGFLNISSYDLKVIVKEMTFANHEWSKRYFARQVCHLIYELINDLFEILGKDFKREIDKLTDNNSLVQSLTKIRQELNLFKEANFKKLQEIRNVSSAHRDKDFLVQLKIIESISWIEIITIATQFDNIMNDLGKVLQEIIDRSSGELDL